MSDLVYHEFNLACVLLHHCKKHKTHESTCKKCLWWTKAGKCQKRKKLDHNKLFEQTMKFYISKIPAGLNDMERIVAIRNANVMAQLVVDEAIAREKEFA